MCLLLGSWLGMVFLCNFIVCDILIKVILNGRSFGNLLIY